MAVTIKDIARICGVSAGTVDRAINDRSGIRKETKDRILKIAEELNYKPNKVAQSLAMGSTKTIGILCFDLENHYFASLVDTIEGIAKSEGYFINLVLTHGDPVKEREGMMYLEERRVDGIILFSVCKDADYIAHLEKISIPIVTIYNRISDSFAFVGVDAKKAMCEAVKFIACKGYERILFINAKISAKKAQGMNVYTLQERQDGYVQGLREMGLHEPFILEGVNRKEICHGIHAQEGRRTAVLCISDMYAVAVLEICKQEGLNVPQDVGIMGYDNMEMLQYITPRIYSVGYDVHLLGHQLITSLLEQMRSDQLQRDGILDYRFMEGESL